MDSSSMKNLAKVHLRTRRTPCMYIVVFLGEKVTALTKFQETIFNAVDSINSNEGYGIHVREQMNK